jgi:hypothetical protein
MTKLTLRAGGVAAAAASTAIIFGAAALAADPQGGRPLTVQMTGAAEAPGPGDPDGTGTASFQINAGQKQVCYELTAQKVATPTGAHIHRAPPGKAGPVVVPLDTPANGKSKNCATVTQELAKELIQTPEAFYVNIHNAEFPPGAIRGQLAKGPAAKAPVDKTPPPAK